MTNKYNTLSDAFRALTDIEILDDENDFPIAVIKVPGLHSITIQMVNSWDFYTVLSPMREKFLNYCLNQMNSVEKVDEKLLLEKVKSLVTDIEACNTKEDVEKRSVAIAHLFKDINIRYEFYKSLKLMKIIKWWVGWKRYQKCTRPIDDLTIFIYLWLFNFDGVKKNAILLFNKIGANTKSHLQTVSSNYGDWDSYKKKLMEADKKFRERSKASLNN